MRRAVSALLLVGVLLHAPAATAINPLDDDAGTGDDAPDTGPDALAISPGQITGRLTPPPDPADRYAVTAQRGEVLSLTLDADGPVAEDPSVQMIIYAPDGRPHDVLMADGSTEFLVTRSGSWVLSVEFSTVQAVYDAKNASAGPTPYTLDVRRTDATHAEIHRTPKPRQTVALRTDGPTEIHLRTHVNITAETGRPSDAVVIIENRPADIPDRPQVMGITFAIIYRSDASGDRLRVVTPAGGQGSPPAPNAVVVDGDLLISFDREAFNGTIRATVIHGGSRPGSLTTLRTSEPVTSAADAGGGLVRWDETNAGSDVQVLTPAVSVTGPRTLEIDVTDRFDGFFRVGRLGGWFEDPNGTRHEIELGGTSVLTDLDPGRWRFHLEATAGTGPAADPWTGGRLVSGTMRTYLLGAPTPDILLGPTDSTDDPEPSSTEAVAEGDRSGGATLGLGPQIAATVAVGLAGVVFARRRLRR